MASLQERLASQNTDKSTKVCRLIFEDYVREKKCNFPNTAKELAVILKDFYVEVRKKDGSEYTKNSLCAIRFGLNRYFKSILGTDIIKHREFDEANRMYDSHCVALKKRGLARTEHKPAISDEDMKKLYECGVFDTDTPATLQNKVFFEIVFYFCRRGRQNIRQLMKDDFAIRTNSNGQRCVVKSDELTDSNQVGDGGMMIANDGPHCPVSSFEKYLSHLNPLNEFLFQRPKANLFPDSVVWYDNVVIGENALGRKMKVLSRQAKLSMEYTNHSIRATTITILDRNGYEARDIMSVSGHRCESSIKRYRKTDETMRARMAGCLMSAIQDETVNKGSTCETAADLTTESADMSDIPVVKMEPLYT